MNPMQKIAELEAEIAALKAEHAAPLVSPLAPKSGFPDLPAIKGVRFASVQAGIKYTDRDDVMLMACDAGSTVAGVFTKSATRSANVLDCQRKLALGANDAPIAILVNSGNSNAFTGRQGDASVRAICDAVADVMVVPADRVFTASTGVIGERLPHDRIVSKVATLSENLSPSGAAQAASAIMTTDTFPKGATCQVNVAGQAVDIIGFAKGSGMIAPDMATMLVYLATDAAIDQPVLQSILSGLNEQTFNCITVDSDTSTSDSLMLVATGQSGAKRITDAQSKDAQAFSDGLSAIMRDLSHQVVRDGEGATKFLEVVVTGASTDASAKTVGLAIANSPLVKTAVAGEDPNWGRVVMGVGKSGEPADRDALSIWFGDILVAENGWVSPTYTETAGSQYMKNADLKITVDLGIGDGKATVWTCDLTHQYIAINADYRS